MIAMGKRMYKTFFMNLLCAVMVFAVANSCGYQMVREKGISGGDIASVYISVFKNSTYEPHASLYVTDAFSKELLSTSLFTINKESSDAYLQGNIKKIVTSPTSLSGGGLVIEKWISVDIELALYRKNGTLIRRWLLSDQETYRVDNIAAEDYNKREALQRLSSRLARRFSSVLLVDY